MKIDVEARDIVLESEAHPNVAGSHTDRNIIGSIIDCPTRQRCNAHEQQCLVE
jgi:hypothetical protein